MGIKLSKFVQFAAFLSPLLLWQCSAQVSSPTPTENVAVSKTSDGENLSTQTEKSPNVVQETPVLNRPKNVPLNADVALGAEQPELYFPLIQGKRIGVVTNQTGILPRLGNQHLVDFLLEKNMNVTTIFAPEHGFRGTADAGELVKNGKDTQTGLPIISLYGKNKKPYASQLANLDVIVFDIQDVGVRFYTYISTLAYVMEAAAEQGKKVIVLDRPNPNRHYVDGPMREPKYTSFVGLHPVPVVYGMTMGEYAKMVNGEKWLKNKAICDLTIIPLQGYDPNKSYVLPVRPSPNLPNWQSINLYPSLCFFEGTNVSIGRGTEMQFQVYGSPFQSAGDFSFTPKPNLGAKDPKHNGKSCKGFDLREEKELNQLNLRWLLAAYKSNTKEPFFNSDLFFDKLAGTDKLRKQIIAGKTEQEIRASWQADLQAFEKIRGKYLLY